MRKGTNGLTYQLILIKIKGLLSKKYRIVFVFGQLTFLFSLYRCDI